MSWPVRCVVGVVLLAATGCGGGAPSGPASPPGAIPASPSMAASPGTAVRTLTVFAPESLRAEFTLFGREFESVHTAAKARLTFGDSAALAKRIARGERPDVFASVGKGPMRETGVKSAEIFTRSMLEIAVPKGNPAKIAKLKDLSRSGLKVAFCAEKTACGEATAKTLRAAGIAVTPAVRERDVSAALAMVETGELDAALVYRRDIIAAARKLDDVYVPEAEKAIENYVIAAMPKAAQPALAADFIQLVHSGLGMRVLSNSGYIAP